MRITFLTHFPGKGGSSSLLLQMSEFLQGLNHKIAMVVGDDCAETVLKGYTVVPRNAGEGWKGRMAAYVKAVLATRPDVVYSISGKDEYDVFRFLSCVRIRHVSSMEQHEFADIPYWIQQVDRFTDAFTANTPDVLARIRSLTAGSTRNQFAGWTVPYRVNPAFNTIRKTQLAAGSADADVVNVCFIARLDQFQKRAHWLPEIMERCQSAGRNFRWHIYGQGPIEPFIKARVEQRKLSDKVCFYGWTDAAALAVRLPLHDVFFLCSRWEGLSVAMVEAMLCGLACVVPADSGGTTYALHEGGGWLYQARSPAACAASLIAATSDPKVLIIKKQEAQAIAHNLFTGRVADEQLAAFAASLPKLRHNGNLLEIAPARRMHSVRAIVALKRLILGAGLRIFSHDYFSGRRP